MRIDYKNFIVGFILTSIIATITLINGNNAWAGMILILYVVLTTYCVSNTNKHMVLLMFSACYFVFLVGGIIVKEYLDYDMSYTFNDDDYSYMLFAIFISLFFVFVVYIVSEKISIKGINRAEDKQNVSDENRVSTIRSITLWSQYVLLIPYVLVLVESIIIVRQFGYYEYYSFESTLPYIITELSDFYIVSLFMYLSTIPDKREARIPLLIFVVLNCVSLLTGRRIYFVVDNMIVLCYCFYRNKMNPEDKWIKRRHFYLIIAALPFAVIFLYTYNYIRMNSTSKAESLFDAFFLFFRQQGFSANLVPLGKIYSDRLSDDIYSMYDILRYIRLNPIIRVLTGSGSAYSYMYNGTREHLALYSGSFARAISYAVVKARYIGGYGMGSCYIAELYHDFGYLGICAGNIIYGATMSKINTLSKGRVLRNTFILLMIRGLFKSPRYCFDSPYYMFFSFEYWIFIGLVYGVANIINKKKHNFDSPI